MRRFIAMARRLAAACLVVLATALPLCADAVGDALQRGDAAAARVALERQIAGRRDANLLRAQLEGMIALRRGDYAGAARIFRSILAIAPSFEPARLQLVVALQAAGERREAMFHARRIVASTDDRRLRDSLLAEIARDRNARPRGLALRFALLPSSNITGGSSANTVIVGGLPFELDPGSRNRAGVGLAVGATAWNSWTLSDRWRATLSGSVDQRIYSTSVKPDETDLGLRLDLTRRTGRSSFSFGPRATFLFLDGEHTRRQVGFGFAGEYQVNPRLWLGYSGETLRQDFPAAFFRDGWKTQGSATVKWAATKSLLLSAEVSGLRETTRAAHLAHRDLGLGLGVETRLKAGTVLGLDLFRGRNRYDGVFPGFDVARRDNVTSLRLSVQDPRISWRGITPEFSITRKRQASNIPLHDNWATDFGLTLTRRF